MDYNNPLVGSGCNQPQQSNSVLGNQLFSTPSGWGASAATF